MLQQWSWVPAFAGTTEWKCQRADWESSARTRGGPMPERPEEKIALDAVPDADEAERLEDQEADHDEAEGGIVHGKDFAGVTLGAWQHEQGAFDPVGKQGDEYGAGERTQQRSHPADDDHGDVLDREKQRE